MFAKIFKRLYQQLLLLVVVSLILIAAYVSAGRQFMPAVSGYTGFFEEQIYELTGVPVSIQSLTGSFEGFNPSIRINGLHLLVGNEPQLLSEASALEFESASVSVDIPRSIWQRRWVLDDFVIETLEIDVEQTAEGIWQLSGMSLGGAENASVDNLFQTFQRITTLNLRNVTINVQTNTGNSFTLGNGSATIQNLGQSHFLHINANLQQSSEQIAFSFEIEGDELADIDGQIHIDIPESDYSALLSGQQIAGYSVEELVGGGGFWLTLREGRIARGVTDVEIDSVTLLTEQLPAITLQNISGIASVDRDLEADSWELAMSDMSITWEDHFWRPFNLYIKLQPDVSLTARADNIDLALVSEFAASSGYLGSDAQQQIQLYSPDGALENFSLYYPFAGAANQHLLVKSNLAGAEVGSVRGSPNMWGINGYVEVDYDNDSRQALGLAEIESNEFSINIPSLFTDVWDYSFVNGSLGFRVDLSNGQEVKLVSSIIVAESDAVDARTQFTSTVHSYPDGERDARLELLVGAQRVDAEQKSLYLPDGPNIADSLRASMEWLDDAIQDGDVYDSGVIFRGSTIRGSDPVTKTFQSFYRVENGAVNFSEEWPQLEELSAYVVTDDNNIDIEAFGGSSLGLEIESVSGEIRRDESDANWLTLSGNVAGLTSQALDYLQQAPLGQGLKDTFASWQAEGEFVADIEVAVPLNRPENDTAVRLDIAVTDNKISIPDYALEVAQLSGPIIFDTKLGLEESNLSGQLFDGPVELTISSQLIDGGRGEIATILVDADGISSPEELAEWPLQSGFVRDLLARAAGEIDFHASLSIDQRDTAEVRNKLVIESDLMGASLVLPTPFNKSTSSSLPLHVELEFGEQQGVSGNLGSVLAFDLALLGGVVVDGVVYVGEGAPDPATLGDSETEGLVIVGELNHFELEQWTDFFSGITSVENPAQGFANNVAFVDVMIDNFVFYDQQLADVAMRIEPDEIDQGWLTKLNSDSLAGWVTIPYDSTDYLDLDFEYLRLPGDDEETLNDTADSLATPGALEEQERIDVLANIDPSELPRMHFATDELSIGSLYYGSWQFTLDPTAGGAEVNDLVFDFRGLRVGMEGPFVDGGEIDEYAAGFAPRFNWSFDGEQHRSELRGILYADDMADFLTANGFAASLESNNAIFFTDINWPGTPAFFAASNLSGEIDLEIEDGRFLQGSDSSGALKLISIINFDALMRRLRFSDDLLRSGLAYDEISAQVNLQDGLVNIEDQLVISGPSSLYQITGEIDLAEETILGEMFVTLPISDNIPWLGLLTANIPLAVGAYLFDRVFGDQVDSLTSAVYTLEGPWEGLQPEFKQAFGSPESELDSNTPQ